MISEAVGQFSSYPIRFIADPALRAIVMACLAACTLWIFRVRNASMKLAAWTAILCAALALPVLGLLLPPLFMRLPIIPVTREQTSTSEMTRSTGPMRGPIPTTRIVRGATIVAFSNSKQELAAPETGNQTFIEKHVLISCPVLTTTAYLLVLAVLAVRLFVGLIVTRRMRRGAMVVDDPGPQLLVKRYAREMRLHHLPQLLESSAVKVPLTLGVLRCAIVIPESWRGWEEAKLAAVMAHEVSHVRRRDSLIRLLAAVYRSIFWFSPLGWWLEHHIADLGEQASDEAAIDAGAEPTYYAEVLMSFFGAIQNGEGRMNWQGAQITGGRKAANRIERVLSLKMLKPSGFRRSRVIIALAGVLPLVCVMAAARPKFVLASAAPQAERPPAAPAPSLPSVAPVSPPAPVLPVAPAPSVAPVAPPAPTTIPSTGDLEGIITGTVAPVIRLMYPIVPQLQPVPPLALLPNPKDDDMTYRSSSFNGGMDFAIVSGGSVTMNGSEDNRNAVEALRKKVPGDFIWFIHDGTAYVIRDAATVQAAKQLYAPMDDLGKQQEELGKQQEKLGRQQEELGKQMEAVRVEVPADLVQRLQEVEGKIKALGGSANMEQLGHLQGELGELQGQLGSLQGKAGFAQGSLGAQQGSLGAKQGELGRQQGELGRKLAALARDTVFHMRGIIGKALADDTAKRVE